jgi:hypothetical protein
MTLLLETRQRLADSAKQAAALAESGAVTQRDAVRMLADETLSAAPPHKSWQAAGIVRA